MEWSCWGRIGIFVPVFVVINLWHVCEYRAGVKDVILDLRDLTPRLSYHHVKQLENQSSEVVREAGIGFLQRKQKQASLAFKIVVRLRGG